MSEHIVSGYHRVYNQSMNVLYISTAFMHLLIEARVLNYNIKKFTSGLVQLGG